MKKNKKKSCLSRRDFIKIGGLGGAGLGLAGMAGAGYVAGKDTDSYTGWERYTHGEGQFFNRKPFEVTTPTSYEKVGPTRRIDAVEQIFFRLGMLSPLMRPGRDGSPPKWNKEMGTDLLPDEKLAKYYRDHPHSFEELMNAEKKSKIQHENWEKFRDRYAIADAWSNAHSASMRSFPPRPKGPPEEWDFKQINEHKLVFKSPKHASELIKKIAHTFGATLVGLTKLNPDWVYQGMLRGVGKVDFEVPKHWKNCIVVATPHEWDALYSNPTYGTSYDGYSRECMIAGKMEVFLKDIGYAARAHVPGNSYEVAAVPIAIDAGLGELGRNNVLITPELGANARLAVITTNLDLESDKPIDIGVKQFCEKCKICAEQCPSGSLSFDDKATSVVRGYKRWDSDHDKCYTMWNTVAASHARGCRVCLAVCPYSRKNNWIHTIAREVDPRDPTGLFSTALLAMQKGLFKYPEKAENYMPPPDGSNETYHEAPDWLRTEEWCDVNVDWE